MTDHVPDRPALSRRGFVAAATSVAAATLIPATPALGAIERERSPATSRASAGAFELEERSIAELQTAFGRGELTSHQLVEQYLQRIDSMDRRGPNLRHVLETNPEALAIADALDAERKAGKVRGPMHGIPVLVKDNIDTADRMNTTAGSLALLGSAPARDSFVAQKLREAGAVILGKTNLSEWANFRSTHSSSGWSGRGGQTRNPYAIERNPCGSSSGSAVAVAANFCAVSI